MFTSANSPNRARRRAALSAFVAATLGLSACAVGPNFHAPPPPNAPTLGEGLADPAAAPAPADWWIGYGSPELDGLVRKGLADSPSLAASVAALEQSQAQARAGAAVFFPNVNGSFGATRDHASPMQLGEAGAARTFSLYTISGSVGYTLDLFGGQRRAVEQLNAQSEGQRAALAGVRLVLAGNIVEAAIAHAGYQAQHDALTRIVALEEAQLTETQALYDAGRDPRSAVLNVSRQLDADRAGLTGVEERDAAAANLLRMLLGLEPGEVLPPTPAFEGLTPPVAAPAAIPARLVRQRPDILQAEAQVHAASAGVGVAAAQLLPSINLTGDYGAANTQLSALGAASGRFWAIGPTVDMPLFAGGARWHGLKASRANLRKALAAYRQTVLVGLEQTSDALRNLKLDDRIAQSTRSSYEAASESALLTGVGRTAGVNADYDAATAEIVALRAKLDMISARGQRLQDAAALFVAVGGGWDARASAP